MKKIIFTAFGIVLPLITSAQLPEGLDPYVDQIKSGDVSEHHIAVIYAILQNTQEVCIHQQNGAKDNKVYVGPEGRREAVYDKDGELVQDGINDGSYNFFHPSEQPLNHFSADISPWIVWGQSKTDVTTVKSRIYAYMGDLEGGIRRALELKKLPEPKVETEGQMQALAVFLRAIEEGDAEALFDLFESKKKVTDKRLIDVLTRLNKGLDKIYTDS